MKLRLTLPNKDPRTDGFSGCARTSLHTLERSNNTPGFSTSTGRLLVTYEGFNEEVGSATGSGLAARSVDDSGRPTKKTKVVTIELSNDPAELLSRLETPAASAAAGNTSVELRNEASGILGRFLERDHIDRGLFKELSSCFE